VSCEKAAEPIEMSFGTPVGPRKHALDGGANWLHLAITIEQSMCDGDAAFLSNYVNHLLCFLRIFIFCWLWVWLSVSDLRSRLRGKTGLWS